MKIKDLTGMRFGKLTVVGIGKKVGYSIYWLCKCDCGSETLVCVSNIRRTNSCGCSKHENQHALTHGQNRGGKPTREYQTWRGIKDRCNNIHNAKYSRYGGRGIKVCEEWQDSFETFFKDMGRRPIGYSIDRKNNDGDYSAANCRWATKRQQSDNTSQVILLSFNGQLVSQCNLAKLTGIPMQTLSRWRIKDPVTFEEKIKRRMDNANKP